jgi:hypothetical protein
VILPDQVYGSPKSVGQYLNPAAFQCAGSNAACTVFSGQFGNLGRNSLYGPGQRNFNIAVSRQFRIRERFRTEFRSDFFNILNHANWNNPVSALSSGATFGQITSFGSPRIIQMSMKLFF